MQLLILIGVLWTGALVLFGTLAATDTAVERFIPLSIFTTLSVATAAATTGYVSARLRQGQHELRAELERIEATLNRVVDREPTRDLPTDNVVAFELGRQAGRTEV